jgi:hypothetical protein
MQAAQSLEARTVFVAPKKRSDVRDFGDEEEVIKQLFEKLGAILAVRKQYDTATKRFGFAIEFASIKAAQAAAQLSGITLRNRELLVSSSHDPAAFADYDEAAAAKSGTGAGTSTADGMTSSAALPNNHKMPEDLRIMPVLAAELPNLGAFTPLPPAAPTISKVKLVAPGADDDGGKPEEGGDDNVKEAAPPPMRLIDSMERKPGSDVFRELAEEQARFFKLHEDIARLEAELVSVQRAVEQKEIELDRIAAAAKAGPKDSGAGWSVHARFDARISRTVLVYGCPPVTNAVSSAIAALQKHGPIRLQATLVNKHNEELVNIAVEFIDEEAAKAALQIKEGRTAPCVELGDRSELPVYPIRGIDEKAPTIRPAQVPAQYKPTLRAAEACLNLSV